MAAGSDELLGVLKVAMALDGFAEQTARIERRTVGVRDEADFALRNHGRFGYRHAEQVRMNRPQSRRQRAQLNAFDAALLDEGNRVLEIVMRVLRAVGREDAARRIRFAVDGFDDAHLVGTNFDERHFAHDFLKRPLDQVQARLEHIGLNADFAFGGDDATGRHPLAEVAAFFDGDLARADVDEDAPQDGQHDDERDEREYGPG